MLVSLSERHPVAYTVLQNKGSRPVIVSVFHGDVGAPLEVEPPHMAIYEGTGVIGGTTRATDCTRMPFRIRSGVVGFDPNQNDRRPSVADSDLSVVGKFQVVYGLRMEPGSTFTVLTMAASPASSVESEAYTINVRTDFTE